MYGSITFSSARDLAEFLKGFSPCTAKFNVEGKPNGTFVLTFTGAY